MKTCQKCGIRYENVEGKCPLCENEEVTIEVYNTATFTRLFYWRIYSVFSLAAFLILLVIDLVYSHSLSWSKIPLSSIVYIWLTLFIILKLRFKSFLLVITQSVITIILLILLDSLTPGKPWFTGFALPVVISLYLFVNFTLFCFNILHFSILQKFALISFNAGVFLLILELLLNQYKQNAVTFSWSLIAFICILTLGIFFLYLNSKIKKSGKELRKYFHF